MSICIPKQGQRRLLQPQRPDGVREVPPVLRHRPEERTAVRAVPAGGQEEPGAPRPGGGHLPGTGADLSLADFVLTIEDSLFSVKLGDDDP